MKTLATLSKELDFQQPAEYFDYCINSHVNGNFEQCKRLFYSMTKKDRKELLKYIIGCYDYPQDKAVYNFYFELI